METQETIPLAHKGDFVGAGEGIRTHDLLITNQLLCRTELRQRAVECSATHPANFKHCQRGSN